MTTLTKGQIFRQELKLEDNLSVLNSLLGIQVSTTCHVLFSHIHVTSNNSMFGPWLKTESVAAASRGELLTGRFVRTW